MVLRTVVVNTYMYIDSRRVHERVKMSYYVVGLRCGRVATPAVQPRSSLHGTKCNQGRQVSELGRHATTVVRVRCLRRVRTRYKAGSCIGEAGSCITYNLFFSDPSLLHHVCPLILLDPEATSSSNTATDKGTEGDPMVDAHLCHSEPKPRQFLVPR